MGKLTGLLKMKKAKGDDSSLGMQRNAASTMSGSSAETPMPLSLSLSMPSADLINAGSHVSVSLMDDIMDELAGTTPDTPQPSHTSSKIDFDDFGLAFELSRQLDLSASQTDTKTISSNRPIKVGRLEHNSALKNNVFLRSQQQLRSGVTPASSTPGVSHRQIPNIYGTSVANTNTTTSKTTPSYLRGLSSKEIEEKAEAAVKLREASRKANNQLPSDDEESEASDSDGSDDDSEAEKQKQQKQQQLQQHQQQQQLQHEQAAAKTEFLRRDDNAKKARPANPEDVINRMKDRHRAVLVGAAAAVREEYYEEYLDEYGRLQQMQPQGLIGYNLQY
ncbi:hypothetical protein BGX27_008707, partial [Mortierella sp. AM989]